MFDWFFSLIFNVVCYVYLNIVWLIFIFDFQYCMLSVSKHYLIYFFLLFSMLYVMSIWRFFDWFFSCIFNVVCYVYLKIVWLIFSFYFQYCMLLYLNNVWLIFFFYFQYCMLSVSKHCLINQSIVICFAFNFVWPEDISCLAILSIT